MHKKQVSEKDIPRVVHAVLIKEAAILHRVIKALRKEIQNKKKEAR